MSTTVLVCGATGAIGSAVTQALLDQGAPVRTLVRDGQRARLLPPGAQPVLGDLRDPATVAAALAGVGCALYISPHDPGEVHMAETFVRACERAQVRLVFAGVYVDGSNAVVRWLARLLIGLALPHYRGKLRIGRLIADSRARPVAFGLTNYFQNDELIREQILNGRYVLPTHHRGVNRIDLRDAAEVIARAMTDPHFRSGGYPLCGPESVSAIQAARTWAAALGRPVHYPGAEVDLAAEFGGRLSAQKLADFQRSYRLLTRFGVPTSAHDLAITTELLGRAPRSYETYVRDMAARWSSEIEQS